MKSHTITLTERELRNVLVAFDYCARVKIRYRAPLDVQPQDVRRWRTRPDVAATYERLLHAGENGAAS